MFTLSRVVALIIALVVCLFGSTSLRAEYTVLSGMFDGTEPAAATLWGDVCTQVPLGYRQSVFQVSKSGTYSIYDAYGGLRYHGGMDVTALVYEASFNASTPRQNLKAAQSVEFSSTKLSLTSGVTYVLVVQHRCEAGEGPWVVTFAGPGAVSSPSAVTVPGFTQGKFTANDPKMFDGCIGENSGYQQSGPIRVTRAGTYYVTDAQVYPLVTQACLQVYTAPVNPADPASNRIGNSTSFKLHPGQDYYFVVQRAYGEVDGEYFYLLAPPAPFRINPGLAGAWYNPDTPGQGFFLTVYEKLKQVFLGWFTFTDNPAPDDEYGHRWMTAFGKFSGASADLALEWTSGGAFDSATPVPQQVSWGEIRLDFTDCSSGKVTYAFGPSDSGGYQVEEIPIRRHTDDAVALCESLYAGPAMPGPL